MILNPAVAIAMVVPCRVPLRPMCLASNSKTDQLRAQLDQLHSEAERTRVKGFLLFSVCLSWFDLVQGHKLSAYHMIQRSLIWFQAISLKETKLVGSVAVDLEDVEEIASNPVRIISLKQENTDRNEIKEFEHSALEFGGRKDLQLSSHGQEILPVDNDPEDLQASSSVGIWKDDIMPGLSGVSSYKDFLEHMDQELGSIEAELLTILRVSTLVLDDNDTTKNLKVQQTQELLQDIRGIRKRIGCIKLTKVETA